MYIIRKSKHVDGGVLIDPPLLMTYLGVVIRYSVRLDFPIASLDGLDILAGNIQNAYLNTTTKEKLFSYTSDEWKYGQGRVVVTVWALHTLKSSDLVWRNHCSDILGNHLGFQSYLANPNIWFKAETDKSGNEYYTYILVYVDDLLIVDKYPRKYMAILNIKYMMKPSSIGETKVYLGSDFGKVFYGNGSYTWTMISDMYAKEDLKNMKKRLNENGT